MKKNKKNCWDSAKKLLLYAIINALLLAPVNAIADTILFAHVDNYGNYHDDGERIKQMLVNAGHTVTSRDLDVAVYTDYDDFNQIFVYDLYHGTDRSSIQDSNYQGIASWYNDRTNQNLILDGRIISSDSTWTSMSNGTKIPEDEWIQNYATQLEARGGGLVLGTDHNAFQSGINRINELINISLFHGNYYTAPLVATVDPLSPLYVSGFPVINDNSSTGFVATGIQANGQTLTPVAYHGETSTAWDWAAVSSTMGSATFGTEVPEPATMMLFGLGLLGVAGIGRRKK